MMATGLTTSHSFANANSTLFLPHINLRSPQFDTNYDLVGWTNAVAYSNAADAAVGAILQIDLVSKDYTYVDENTLTAALEDTLLMYPNASVVIGMWDSASALAALPWLNEHNLTAISAYTSAPALAEGDDNYVDYYKPLTIADFQLYVNLFKPLQINGVLMLWDTAPFTLPYMPLMIEALNGTYPYQSVTYTPTGADSVVDTAAIITQVKASLDKLTSAIVQQDPSTTAASQKIAFAYAGHPDIELQIIGALLADAELGPIFNNNLVLFPVINALPPQAIDSTNANQTAAVEWANKLGQYQASYSLPGEISAGPIANYALNVYKSNYTDPVAAVADMYANCTWCNPDQIDLLDLISAAYEIGGYQWPKNNVSVHRVLIAASSFLFGTEGYMLLNENATLAGASYIEPLVNYQSSNGSVTYTITEAIQLLSGNTTSCTATGVQA